MQYRRIDDRDGKPHSGGGAVTFRRAAPPARRREGLKPNGRDGEIGTGRSPKAWRRLRRHAIGLRNKGSNQSSDSIAYQL